KKGRVGQQSDRLLQRIAIELRPALAEVVERAPVVEEVEDVTRLRPREHLRVRGVVLKRQLLVGPVADEMRRAAEEKSHFSEIWSARYGNLKSRKKIVSHQFAVSTNGAPATAWFETALADLWLANAASLACWARALWLDSLRNL